MLRSKHLLWVLTLGMLSCNAWAVDKTITISWTVLDTTDVTGYKMYFAYDSTMTNKQLACETSDPTATTLTCPRVNIEQSPVYFAIAAVTTESEAISSPVAENLVTSISIVQDFRLETQTSESTTPTPTTTFSQAVNFQPADVPVPDGYAVDSGLAYDNERGYGWITGANSSATRDRDSTVSQNQAYDTLFLAEPTSSWEYTLADGTYTVTICIGDATWPSSTNNIQVEGQTFFSNEVLDINNKWVEKSQVIRVTDGHLTVTFSQSNPYSQLCWIKITQ